MTDTNIKYSETDSKFLEKFANCVSVDNEQWFYMPFYFKKISDNVYKQVSFERLPENVKEFISKSRNNILKPHIGILG